MIKFKKSAIKAWSTWGLGVLTVLAFAHTELMPLLQQFIEPDDYTRIMGVMGIVVIILRFIDQELRDD